MLAIGCLLYLHFLLVCFGVTLNKSYICIHQIYFAGARSSHSCCSTEADDSEERAWHDQSQGYGGRWRPHHHCICGEHF